MIKIKQIVNRSDISDSEGKKTEIKNLKNLHINKASGIDTIPLNS